MRECGGGRGFADGGVAHCGEGAAQRVVACSVLPGTGGDDDGGVSTGGSSGSGGDGRHVRRLLIRGEGFVSLGLIRRNVEDLTAGIEAGFAEAVALGEHCWHDAKEETGWAGVLHVGKGYGGPGKREWSQVQGLEQWIVEK